MELSRSELKRLKCISNNVLVKIDPPGKEVAGLIIVTDYEPNEHVQTKGEVVKVPKNLVVSYPNLEWSTDIAVSVGDEVNFTVYAGITGLGEEYIETQESPGKFITCEGELYIFVSYPELIYNHTTGLTLNGYCIVEPIHEKESSVILVQEKEKFFMGKVVWDGPKNNYYLESPRNGKFKKVNRESDYPVAGDTIVYRRHANIKYDDKYYQIKRRDMLCVANDEIDPLEDNITLKVVDRDFTNAPLDLGMAKYKFDTFEVINKGPKSMVSKKYVVIKRNVPIKIKDVYIVRDMHVLFESDEVVHLDDLSLNLK